MFEVEPPTASRPTLRLTAIGVGVRTAVELTVPAAGALAAMLQTVSAAADFIHDEGNDQH
jgi:hypothetical protein